MMLGKFDVGGLSCRPDEFELARVDHASEARGAQITRFRQMTPGERWIAARIAELFPSKHFHCPPEEIGVRRAQEIVEERVGEPVTVSELAAGTGVSATPVQALGWPTFRRF